MFYYLTLKKTIDIQPRYFGPRLREVIMEKLIAEVSRVQRARGRGTGGGGNASFLAASTHKPHYGACNSTSHLRSLDRTALQQQGT